MEIGNFDDNLIVILSFHYWRDKKIPGNVEKKNFFPNY